MQKQIYYSPDTELTARIPECVLASSFNGDDNTEYLDYEDGGLL